MVSGCRCCYLSRHSARRKTIASGRSQRAREIPFWSSRAKPIIVLVMMILLLAPHYYQLAGSAFDEQAGLSSLLSCWSRPRGRRTRLRPLGGRQANGGLQTSSASFSLSLSQALIFSIESDAPAVSSRRAGRGQLEMLRGSVNLIALNKGEPSSRPVKEAAC